MKKFLTYWGIGILASFCASVTIANGITMHEILTEVAEKVEKKKALKQAQKNI